MSGKLNQQRFAFIIIKDFMMEKQVQQFPYQQIGDIVYLSKEINPSHMKGKQESAKFYQRFPMLRFQNSQLAKKYCYKGEQTQKAYPFFIRFNITQQIPQNIDQINQHIQSLKTSVPSSIQKAQRKLESDESQCVASSFSQHYGYLLTGIAKPNISANQIYDTLFLQMSKTKDVIRKTSKDNDDDSYFEQVGNNSSNKAVYNIVKLKWEYKYHSYEYLYFMSRAYDIFYKKLMLQYKKKQEIDDVIKKELFGKNLEQQKFSKYIDGQGQDILIAHKEYFNYFGGLLKKYHKQIMSLKPIDIQKKTGRKYKMWIEQKQHYLYEFDFQLYLRKQFDGQPLQAQSLNRMIRHNQQRNENILHNYPFKTYDERLSLIKSLQNKDRTIHNRVKVISLLTSANHATEEDNFLIIFLNDEETNISESCCLKDVLKKRISIGLHTPPKSTSNLPILKIAKQKIFHDIYIQSKQMLKQQQKQTQKINKHYKLLKHYTYDPAQLNYLEGYMVSHNFENAMMKMLQLDKLPLTLEQELMMCTPDSNINIYQQLQKLAQEYAKCSSIQDLEQFTAKLNDVNQGRGQAKLNCSGVQQKGKDDELRVRLNLLELTMIEFQGINLNQIFYAAPWRNKQQYNSLSSSHYKQLRYYLAILLIQTGFISNIKDHSNIHSQQLSNHIDRVQEITKQFYKNWKDYHSFIQSRYQQKSFRFFNQFTFRNAIKQIYQQLQTALLPNIFLREIMRVSYKVFIALQYFRSFMIAKHNNQYVILKLNNQWRFKLVQKTINRDNQKIKKRVEFAIIHFEQKDERVGKIKEKDVQYAIVKLENTPGFSPLDQQLHVQYKKGQNNSQSSQNLNISQKDSSKKAKKEVKYAVVNFKDKSGFDQIKDLELSQSQRICQEDLEYAIVKLEDRFGFEDILKLLEGLSKQEHAEIKQHSTKLKQSILYLQKQISLQKKMLKGDKSPLKSIQSIEEREQRLKRVNLLLFSNILKDLRQLQNQNNQQVVYKILLCLCCQFQDKKSQLLPHHFSHNMSPLNMAQKVYKFKMLLLSELIKVKVGPIKAEQKKGK